MMETLSATEARKMFAELVNRAAYGGGRFVVERHGEPVAAIISAKDLALLERLIAEEEDRIDLRAAKAALAEGGEPVPFDEVMRRLELDG